MRKYLLFLAILFSFSAAAQEGWDVYLANFEKGPGSVMLDMSLLDQSPVKKLPHVVVTGITFKNCDKDGLPNPEEFTLLYRVSDSVQAILKKNGQNIIAGTFTYQCQRLDYFYVSDTARLRKQLMQLYKQRFPGYLPYVNIKKDSSWSTYRDFLYPNEEVYEYMQNKKVLTQLEKAGDQLEKSRVVDHFFYFKTKEDRTCFWVYASTYGFKLESQENTADPVHPFKLHVSRMDKIDLASISKVTIVLRKEARQCRGSYDGWETVLVK